MTSRFAPRPEPPYYAVIFTAQRSGVEAGYEATAERMVDLASQQPGFIGVESTRDASGLGITVSYWRTLDDVAAWKRHLDHTDARNEGRARWYTRYELRVARVERAYGWERPAEADE